MNAYETGRGIFHTDAELPDDRLIPIGSLPGALEGSPLLESLRDAPEFAEFRNEVARQRAVLKRRAEAMRDQLDLAAE